MNQIKLYIVLMLLVFSHQVLAVTEGRCIFIKGDVTLVRGDKKEIMAKNTTVMENDLIVVAPKSMALIKFKYQTVKIIETSSIKVSKLEDEYMKLSLESGGMIINQMKKKLRESSQDNAPLEIKTKTASMGIRGTTFFAYQGDKGQTILSVKKGEVGFLASNSAEEILVSDDKSTMSNSEQKNLKPRKFGFEEEINFNLDVNKNLESGKSLRSELEKSWNKYKDEQEFLWANKKNSEESQWDQWKKLNN